MIKIFIPEYILFIEEVNFSQLLDPFMLKPDVFFFQDVSVNWSSYRTTIESGETFYISKTKEWVYTKFLIGRRTKFFGGYDTSYSFYHKTIKNWFWWWTWWGSIPKQSIYNNFSNLNFLVGNSFINHEFVKVARCDYRLVDCFLLRNHSAGLFNSEWIKLFENRVRSVKYVVYRDRPYANELLTRAIFYYKPALLLAINNPQCIYLDDGLLYARKWVIHVYMTLNSYRPEPFFLYGYWTSKYFPTFLPYLESFFFTDHKYINYFFSFFRDFNFLFILWFFLFYYAIFFYFVFFLYYCSNEKFYDIVLPHKKLFYLYRFFQKFTVIYNAKRKQIRIDKVEFRKEFGLPLNRRRHFESRFLNFLNKNVFNKITIFYWKWVSYIDSQYYEKFKSGNYSLSYLFILMWFIFIDLIFEFFIAPKNVVYYFHYMRHLWLPKYFKNYSHTNFRNKFSFNGWFVPSITYGREFHETSIFEAVKNFIHYWNLYRKDEYKRHIKEKIVQAYEAKMWGVEVEPERKEEYINYYFYRIFNSYYPDDDFLNVFLPRFFSKIFYKSDFSFHKIYTYSFADFFGPFYSKFDLLVSRKGLFRFVFLRYFFSFNFWRLYFYYYYVLYEDKLYNANNLFKIYFFYTYTFFMCIYGLWVNIISIILTKKILIYYFFKHYLFLSYKFLNKFILYNIIFKFFYFILVFLAIPTLIVLYLYDLVHSYLIYFYIATKTRLISLPYYVIISDRGYSYKFWYNYYTFKFYFMEHNFLIPIFFRIANFFTNLLLLVLFLYLLSFLPIVNDFIFGDKMFYAFTFIAERLDIYVKYFHLNYSLNYWNRFYLRNSVLFNEYFEVFVNYYDRKYAYLTHDVYFEFIRYFRVRPFDKFDDEFLSRFVTVWGILERNKFKPLGIDLVSIHYTLFPNLTPWWLFFCIHLYMKFLKEPGMYVMPDVYWVYLPVIVTWCKSLGYYYVFFPFVLMPIAWFLNNFYAFVTFNVLYWTYNTFFYYIFFFILKGFYNLYLFAVYECFYSFYYYYYYKFWILISDYFFTFYMDDIRFSLRKYSFSRYLIAVDFFNIFKLLVNSIFFIINNTLIYFIVNLYRSFSGFFGIVGFSSVNHIDYFSLNVLPTFRPFIGNFYDIVLPSNYDLQEYNSLFSEHVQNRAGKTRRYFCKRHKLNPFAHREKYRLHAFEFKFRASLVFDVHILSNMALVPHLILYRSNNLLFYLLPSVYLAFFLTLFVFALLYIKFAYIFKEYRYYYNSATYEWQTFTVREKRLKLGVDEYYWLYNVRWLRSFEFYWDKCFQDDLFASCSKNDDILGFELVNKLNEMMLQTESKYALGNTYFKLRRYYFEKYLLFIRDIDYFFKIYSIRKHQLGKRWRIYSKYDFFLPLFKKVKNDYNYNFQYSYLNRESRMDYFWVHFVTTYFLREKAPVDYLNFSFHKQLHDTIQKSLFKAYAIFEMNQKEFPFDLFEFQFFEPEFLSDLYEHFNSYDEDKQNTVLRKIIYSRSNTQLLYSSAQSIQSTFDFAIHSRKINDFFIYLHELNKHYFNGFVDFSLFNFMNSFSNVITNISPNIAKTAVDIDRGDLIGVSYKKSMLLDEFTSTEITESVFDSVDYFFSKTKFNNIDMYKVFLKEEGLVSDKPISLWWFILAIIPFFFFYIELDSMFKYGRYITPQGTFTDIFQYIFSHFFSERISNKFMWVKYFVGDFVNWTKKLKFQVKTAHFRSLAWEVRWIELLSFWTGNNAHLVQSKLDHAWFFFNLWNDYGRYYNWPFSRFTDFYIRSVLGCYYVLKIFLFLKFLQFLFFSICLFLTIQALILLQKFLTLFEEPTMEGSEERFRKRYNEFVAMKEKSEFEELDEQLDKHRKTVDFILKYKEDQKKKKLEEQNRRLEREIDEKRE